MIDKVYMIKEEVKSAEGKHIFTQLLIPCYATEEIARMHLPLNNIGWDIIITYSIVEVPLCYG